MKENKRRTTILIIITIAVFLVAVLGATYAYFSTNRNVGAAINANVGTAGKMYQFTATSNGNIEMNIAFNEMSEANISSEHLKTDNATIDVSLASPSEDVLSTCTYDIVWAWDSDTNNRYTEPDVELPYKHTDNKVYDYEFSTKVDSESETDLSEITLNGNTLTLKSGETIEALGTTPATKTHNIAAYVYNLPINQTKLFGKSFKAHITVDNVECNMEEVVSGQSIEIASTYKGAAGSPATVGAIANAECTGGTATYNQKYNQLEISSLSAYKSICNLNYTDRTGTENLAIKIKNLAGNGQVFNENGYRYEGKNVDNYVWFNNELWRIIGVFGENRHGLTGQELVKIIRADSLGTIAFDKSAKQAWETSSLKDLLKGAYLRHENGNNTAADYCYQYSTATKGDCDYTETGISDEYHNMIKEVYWYIGAAASPAGTAEALYTAESTSKTSSMSKIGLMNASDYGYSAPSTICSRTTATSTKYYSGSNACANNSWLIGGGEWTIVPDSNGSTNAFWVDNGGSVVSTVVFIGFNYRPVLYLDSSVYTYAGDGTKANPYIIGMD